MQGEQKKKSKNIIIRAAAAVVLILLLGAGAYMIHGRLAPRGCRDYSIRKEQYFVEYSEQYDYWDVITVEYPVLSGVPEEQAA